MTRNQTPQRSLFYRSPLIMFLTLSAALMGLLVVILLSTIRLISPSQKAGLGRSRAAAATSAWSDEEQVSLNYLPTTPLVADVNGSYPNKEISYINGDGKLVIYASTGGNPIVTTADVAGRVNFSATSELAPTAIYLDNDNYYEILVPGRIGTTWEGTLKAFRGNGSVFSSLNTTFTQGIPYTAPLVDDLDADGNPEIILPVYHQTNATTSLLGWTWTGGQLTGLNSGNPILITVNGSGGFIPKFTAPSVGNIISTSISVKEVAVAVENPDGTMSIYVFRKNGTAIQQIPSGGSWYQENIGATTDNPSVGGIALVDLGGDSRQEIVAATKKTMSSNPMGKYAVRVYSHNFTSGSGQVFSPLLETGIISGIYLPPSRPSIGSFKGQNKAIVFHTIGGSGGTNTNGRGLFAAYFNGSSLQWISGYSPRTITYKDSSPCNIKQEMSHTTITLGDGNNNQTNEAYYSKYYTYINPFYFYSLNYYNAEGAPVDDSNCIQALDYVDVSSFSSNQNPGGFGKSIGGMSNLELADIDGDGLLEMATTYYYPNVNNYNRLYVYDFAGSASSATDWPMAGGNECRQGRYRGSCPPPSSGGPTSTPTPTPSSCPYWCTETDGGKNYTTNGLVNTNWPGWVPNVPDNCGVEANPGNYVHQASCSGSNCYLIERYCLVNSCNNSPQTDILRCNNCSNGVCSSLGSPLGALSYFCNFNMLNNIPEAGKIEAENFACEGQNIAYNDTSSTNEGNSYRLNDRIDIQSTKDPSGGGYNVGWTRAGEWIKYEMNVSTAGYYKFTFRVASASNTGKFKLQLDGNVISGDTVVSVPNTGGNQNWTTLSPTSLSNVYLSAGHHILQLDIVGGYANYNYITLARSSSTTSTPTPFRSPTPTRTPTPAASCKTANYEGGFINTSFLKQTGTSKFTAAFDATPSKSYADILVGLSNGPATAYTSVAAFIRFYSSGVIEARDGAGYKTSTIPYSANSKYRFRLVVDISTRTYAAYVTPPGQIEKTIGTNLKFRSEQSAVTQLNNWTSYVTSSASSVEICNFTLQ